MAGDRSNIGGPRKHLGWSRLRPSVVVPIGVIVAVAIVCVVVAALGSAQRADDIALDNERQLFTRALTNQGERVLREISAVATSEAAYRSIRVSFDSNWVQISVGQRLQSFFDHDFVFVTDPSDHVLYASPGRHGVGPNRFNSFQFELRPVLDVMRGGIDPGGAVTIDATRPENHRAARLQSFLSRPAIVAAVAVADSNEASADVDANAPVILSVKFIDDDMLGEIASRLRLNNLHDVAERAAGPRDYVFNLADNQGQSLARFAWTPKQPGAEILNNVIPFISVVLGAFVLLAGLMLRHMRETAITIAAGETRLRHLALHDPLCGLPNRIFFSERLEATIESVKGGAPPAAIFYIDLDHFKDVNDTLGHPIGDELIRSVTQRLVKTLSGDDLVARLGGDEFAVITSAGYDQATLETIGTRIISSLCAPYSINDQTIVIGASIGVAIINRHVGAVSDVMRHADMALYRAKNEGRKTPRWTTIC